MNQNKGHEGNNPPQKGSQQGADKDQLQNPSGQPGRDRDEADDQGLRRKPDSEPAIPELPEPDVEGVGEEGRDRTERDRDPHTEATMPPGERQRSKRSTM
jgi:hypothetical protein